MIFSQTPIDRLPAVAGKFYPSDAKLLEEDLIKYFEKAIPKQMNNVRGIITPHAGYVFSGVVAASAFNQIDHNKKYDRIFIIASSHLMGLSGASIYCEGDFLMPYGRETVDVELGKILSIQHPNLFDCNTKPHIKEHAIEVQLPFLHFVMKHSYKIVPIIIGTSDPLICERISSALKPYLTPENLFIISSDFSHYPSYEDAYIIDRNTMEAIATNDPKLLLDKLVDNASKSIANLTTSLCGWTSVLTLLHLTCGKDFFSYKEIMYKNSGDTLIYGQRHRVVGYWAIALKDNNIEESIIHLSEREKEVLLHLARESVESTCRIEVNPKVDVNEISETLKSSSGAFVTLMKGGVLRGCIGKTSGDTALYKTVLEMAKYAAQRDSRFSPISATELPELKIEISVLSPLKKIENISEIELGKHGILIKKGTVSGLFLPQVASETGWDKESFLGHCARDKAGIGWDGWKTADIYIFTATVFAENS